ncbi:hypothetical protein [Mycobacterium sp. 155]|uniref:hypothetical protein n=1 Tax=Mycobacterium sp. 155 TaxID=1157943 RepID=UPI00037CBC25|nr:hypothetical protein [Mycobacterium sp. 155]
MTTTLTAESPTAALNPTVVWEALLDAQGGIGEVLPAERALEMVTCQSDVFVFAVVKRRSIRVTASRFSADHVTAERTVKIRLNEFDGRYDMRSEAGRTYAAADAAEAAVDAAVALSQMLILSAPNADAAVAA